MDLETLISAAWHARENAYAVYSGFRVGAALLGSSGKRYTGANVENLSYGLTMCAERVAIFTAIAAGEQHFLALAIAAETDAAISPCGACRQVLAEFAPSLPIVAEGRSGVRWSGSLAELLPRAAAGILNRPA